MQKYIELIRNRKNLTYNEMFEAANLVFNENTAAHLIEDFLIALSEKGETATEIVALVDVMRAEAVRLPQVLQGEFIDNCGTGGDGLKSFNISTAAAFVIAASGIQVAKHGNRKVSSASGSADILEELGIRTDLTTEQLCTLLKQEGLAFLFAPAMHPKLKRIGQIRSKIGKPTIFNLVGPLANPVDLTYQFTGINKPQLVVKYAEVMKKLGRKRALVVSGEGGMDEASLYGKTTCTLLDEDELISFTITPEEVGLQSHSVEAVLGGNPKENARILRELLKGKRDAYFDAVALNAGLAIYTANKALTIQEGVKIAIETINSGKAYEKLQAVVSFNQLEVVK